MNDTVLSTNRLTILGVDIYPNTDTYESIKARVTYKVVFVPICGHGYALLCEPHTHVIYDDEYYQIHFNKDHTVKKIIHRNKPTKDEKDIDPLFECKKNHVEDVVLWG
jgi:hypothetical protein